MKKVFLYLYPIEEYTKTFLYADTFYELQEIEKPLPLLNECIQKRYRDKGYTIVYCLYPDKKIFGIVPAKQDKIIYTDISFEQNSVYDDNGKRKRNFIPKYPNEELILQQLGDIEKIVIGGYHFNDCVKRVGNVALEKGIDTLVDLDLTDLFYTLYKKKEYFKIENYDPIRYKKYLEELKEKIGCEDKDFSKKLEKTYSSSIYKMF